MMKENNYLSILFLANNSLPSKSNAKIDIAKIKKLTIKFIPGTTEKLNIDVLEFVKYLNKPRC